MSLVVMSTKTKPTSLPFSLRTDGGPVLYLISAKSEIGTCAPVGVGTSTRLSASISSRKSLAALDGGRDVFATDGALNDVVHITDSEAVARGGFAVHNKIKEIAADG